MHVPTTKQQFYKSLENTLSTSTDLTIVTPNAEILQYASKDREYAEQIAGFDIFVPDGIGVFIKKYAETLPKWVPYFVRVTYAGIVNIFSKGRIRRRFGDRILGREVTEWLLYYGGQHQLPVLIIDQDQSSYNDAYSRQKMDAVNNIDTLSQQYNEVNIHYVWIQGNDYGPAREALGVYPHALVLICNGMKKQEACMAQLASESHNTKAYIACGSSIDILLGIRDEVPEWIAKAGFEWLFRLYKRPKQHFRRILNIFRYVYSRDMLSLDNIMQIRKVSKGNTKR